MLRLRLVDLELDRVAARPAGEAGKRAAEEEDERVHLRPVAEERPEEAMEGVRQPAGHERGEPAGDRGEERRDRPEEPPQDVRDREQEPEEHREPVALAVVRDLQADGVRRHRVERHGVGVARRVAVVQEEQVAERLRRVALAVDLRVAQAGRRPCERERGEPRQHGEREAETAVGDGERPRVARPAGPAVAAAAVAPSGSVRDGGREHQRRERQEDPQRDGPAPLRAGRRELRLDHVAGLAEEARIAAGGEVGVGVDVERVAHVGRVERVRPLGGAAADQRDHPVDRRDHHRSDAPHPQPDEVGDHDEEAEEDRRPRAGAVVRVSDPDPAA